MDETPPAKPRLEFRRAGQAAAQGSSRKHVPMEDVLAKMAGKIGERRRAAEAERAGRARHDADAGESA